MAPFELAENWDNVGLLVGNPEQEISSILVGLDATLALIDEAIDKKANTIITHHPVIFHPLSSIQTNGAMGILLKKALNHNINIIACHTNFDSAVDGVSDVLALSLGLTELQPLSQSPAKNKEGTGLGRVGIYPQPLPCKTFLTTLFSVLDLPSVQVAGKLPNTISKVALCGGSGSELAEQAWLLGANLFLSSEIKHSTARWAEECGFCIIDGTHYSTEKPIVKHIVNKLSGIANTNQWNIQIEQTQSEQHPFSIIQNY